MDHFLASKFFYFTPENRLDPVLARLHNNKDDRAIADIITKLVIHEENHFLALYKPPGVLSQKDNENNPSILEYAESYLRLKGNKPGKAFVAPVHRLDRVAGGVLLLAKTSKGAARLSESFREHKAQKNYLAFVYGVPSEKSGELQAWYTKNKTRGGGFQSNLSPNPGKNREQTTLTYELLAKAQTKEKPATRFPVASALKISIKTGKFHQIRALLGYHRLPIIRDMKYGAPRSPNHLSGIGLIANQLQIPHPVSLDTMVNLQVPDIDPAQLLSLFIDFP